MPFVLLREKPFVVYTGVHSVRLLNTYVYRRLNLRCCRRTMYSMPARPAIAARMSMASLPMRQFKVDLRYGGSHAPAERHPALTA